MKKVCLFITLIVMLFFTNFVSAYDLVGPDGNSTSYLPTDYGIELSIVSINSNSSSSSSSRSSSSSSSGSSDLGHSFIRIKNLTNVSFNIGNYNLNGYEILTIGIYGNTFIHDGIWYNRESKDSNLSNVFKSKQIQIKNIYLLDNFIDNEKNNRYDPVNFNCSTFASLCWYHVTGEYLNPSNGVLDLPDVLSDSIIKSKNYDYNIFIPNSKGYCFYHKLDKLVLVNF